MLATLADEPPPDGENWLYELKYDGFRALTAIVGGQVAISAATRLDLAPRFPGRARARRS